MGAIKQAFVNHPLTTACGALAIIFQVLSHLPQLTAYADFCNGLASAAVAIGALFAADGTKVGG